MKRPSVFIGCLLAASLFVTLNASASDERRPSNPCYSSMEVFVVALAGLATGRQLARWHRQRAH
jgi:hypothetical protein